MMSTMTASRVADDEMIRELGISWAALPPSSGPTSCGVAAITADPQTGEVIVVCVCAAIGYGRTEDEARADLADAHVPVEVSP